MHNRYNITTRDKSLYVYPPHGRAKVIRLALYVVDFEYHFVDIEITIIISLKAFDDLKNTNDA